MKTTKFIPLLFVTIVALSIFGFVGNRGKKDYTLEAKRTGDRDVPGRGIYDKANSNRSYGKIGMPAELSFELSLEEDLKTPVNFVLSAMSKIPVSSGKITLKIPQIDNERAVNTELWSETLSDFVDESLVYTVVDLPVGTYKFVLVFEFEPLGEEPQTLAVSKSLFLDVRPTEILSSNVSFKHIKRLELMKELEERVLADIRPELEYADIKTKTNAIAAIESFDPGLLISKIEQLKTSEPDVAHKIMELNRIEAVTTGKSGSMGFSEITGQGYDGEIRKASPPIFYNQPAAVQEVPVPEELEK
jgi:hypothetical protein